MCTLLFLLLVTMCGCASNDRTDDPLGEMRRLAEQGKFEEALQKHISFHDHILETHPSYYGVRLSFALGEWIELSKKYPKALEALKAIRDQKTSRLVAGETDRSLFHDVESINEHFGESQSTVELFKKIDAAQPAFATSVYSLADEALVETGEYDLARKHLGDPQSRFSTAKENFDRGMHFAAKISRHRDVSRQASESIFIDDVIRIMVVLDRTGDQAKAREIRSEALKVLDSPAIRDAISN